MSKLRSSILLILISLVPYSVSARLRIENLNVTQQEQNIVVSMQMIFDSIKLRPNGMEVFQPVISDGADHELRLQAVVLTGRNQHYVFLRRRGDKRYPNAIEVQREKNDKQSYDYIVSAPYEEWMTGSELSITEDTCGCGAKPKGSRVGQQYAILDNDDPAQYCAYAFLKPQVTDDPILTIKGTSYLDFPLDRTEIYAEYHNNPTELRKITNSIDSVRDNRFAQITSIYIHGYASPEGAYQHNADLARDRSSALKEYVCKLYHFDRSLITVESTPEDWEGLIHWLEQSDIANRDDIMSIVKSDADPDLRDARLRREYAEQYQILLDDVYPYLRHSDYEINYSIRPMSIEEAKEVLFTEPRLLSLNKLYQIAQTYEEGTDEYNQVFDIAARMYPEDPTACLNVANIALQRRDIQTAQYYLKKAGDSPETENARGMLALIQGDYESAMHHFQQSDTDQARQNIDILNQLLERQNKK